MLHFENLVQPYQKDLKLLTFIYDEYLNTSENSMIFFDIDSEKIIMQQKVA